MFAEFQSRPQRYSPSAMTLDWSLHYTPQRGGNSASHHSNYCDESFTDTTDEDENRLSFSDLSTAASVTNFPSGNLMNSNKRRFSRGTDVSRDLSRAPSHDSHDTTPFGHGVVLSNGNHHSSHSHTPLPGAFPNIQHHQQVNELILFYIN